MVPVCIVTPTHWSPSPLTASTSTGSCLYRYTCPSEPFPLPTSTSIGSCLYCYTYPPEPFPSYCQYLNWFLSVTTPIHWSPSPFLPVPQLVPVCIVTPTHWSPSPLTTGTSTGSCLSLHLSTRALPPSYQYLNWFLSVLLHLPTGALSLFLPVPQLVPVCHYTYPLEPFPLPTSTSIGSCLYCYTYPLEPFPSYCQYLNWFLSVSLHLPTGALPPSYQYLNWFLSVLLHLPTGALPLLLPVPQLVPFCHYTYPLEPFPLPTSTSIGSCLYCYTYPLEPFPSYYRYLNWFLSVTTPIH